MNKPPPWRVVLTRPITKAVEQYIDFLDSDDYNEDEDDDYKNAIFEAAVEAVYGKEVWTWIRAKMKTDP